MITVHLSILVLTLVLSNFRTFSCSLLSMPDYHSSQVLDAPCIFDEFLFLRKSDIAGVLIVNDIDDHTVDNVLKTMRDIFQCQIKYENDYYELNDFTQSTFVVMKNVVQLFKPNVNKLFLIASIRENGEVKIDPHMLPIVFVGWFTNNEDQKDLYQFTENIMTEFNGIEQLPKVITEVAKKWEYQKARYHVTAYFVKNHNDESNKHLMNLSHFYGKTYEIKIKGVLMTPRTLSCHVELPEDGKHLFEEKDLVNLKPHITLATNDKTRPVQSGPDEVEVQKIIRGDIEAKSVESSYIAHGKVTIYNDEYVYVDLNEPFTLSLMFLPNYEVR